MALYATTAGNFLAISSLSVETKRPYTSSAMKPGMKYARNKISLSDCQTSGISRARSGANVVRATVNRWSKQRCEIIPTPAEGVGDGPAGRGAVFKDATVSIEGSGDEGVAVQFGGQNSIGRASSPMKAVEPVFDFRVPR